MSEPGRTRWTDDRIDDLAHEIRELRAEMRDGFQSLRTELHADIGSLQAETHADSRALWTEMALSRRWLFGMWATMALGFVGVVIQVSLR